MIRTWGPKSGTQQWCAHQNFALSDAHPPLGHTCCGNKYIWPVKFTPTTARPPQPCPRAHQAATALSHQAAAALSHQPDPAPLRQME
jgi:hypothetical protein